MRMSEGGCECFWVENGHNPSPKLDMAGSHLCGVLLDHYA